MVEAFGEVSFGVASQAIALGIAVGLAYALLGAGLVLVYRATRVINFAHGQLGAISATLLAKAVIDWHVNFWLALALAVLVGAVVGAGIELLIVRRLFDAPRLQLFVATLGVSQVLLFVQFLLPKIKGGAGTSGFPTPISWLWAAGNVRLTGPMITIMLTAPLVVIGLGLFMTRTWAGRSIRAAAANADMAELSGISTRVVSTIVWAMAGALAAFTAVVLMPLQGTPVNAPSGALGPGLLLPALAAGLVGGLRSLPWTLVGGMGIGILQTLAVVYFPTTTGVRDLLLFLVVLMLVMLGRRSGGSQAAGGQWSLALRVPQLPERLRDVWWAANLTKIIIVPALAGAIALPLVFTDAGRIYLFANVIVVALIAISVTVLTGWAGQLSLGQLAFAGLGAVTAASLSDRGFSFPVVVSYAVVAGAVAAALVGLPALRVSGLFLAMTTLAFAIAAQGWLFHLSFFTHGSTSGFTVPRGNLFGLVDLAPQRNYYYLCLGVLVAVAAASARLRRTGIGRAFVATRDNEPCSASFGLSPTVVKLVAFAYSGALAALGGALYAGLTTGVDVYSAGAGSAFAPQQSLQIVATTVIGGLGSVGGAILGAVYVVGLPALFNRDALVAIAASGVGLLILLLFAPGGLAGFASRAKLELFKLAVRRLPPLTPGAVPPHEKVLPQRRTPQVAVHREPAHRENGAPLPEEALALEAQGVVVRFGGLVALDSVHVSAAPAEIVGIIGANGAGKSTLMNVISGFQPAVAGTIKLWGDDVTSMPPYERARLGLGRVFQDARLFPDLTVRETVKLALEVHERSEFVPSLLAFPASQRLEKGRSEDAAQLVDFLGLGRFADSYVSDLSTGTRRIVELCCLLGRGSRLLLLDEPTAGVAQRETEAFGPLIQRIRAELDATIVIIEHDMPLVMSISDRVYCLDAGRNIAEGAPESVRQNPSVIAAYLGTDERAIARSGAFHAGPAGSPANGRVGSTTRGRSGSTAVKPEPGPAISTAP